MLNCISKWLTDVVVVGVLFFVNQCDHLKVTEMPYEAQQLILNITIDFLNQLLSSLPKLHISFAL